MKDIHNDGGDFIQAVAIKRKIISEQHLREKAGGLGF